MATWNQTAGWSSGSLYFDGTTSGRNQFFFQGDNMSIPPLRGRVNLDLVASTSASGMCGSIANPTTEELFVESVIVNVDTASSSCCGLSLGIATADSSSASNIANQTVDCTTAGLTGLNSSGTFPVSWNSSSFFTMYYASTAGGVASLVGDVSVFYVAVPNT